MKIFIYGLFDPQQWKTPIIRYVGQTTNLAFRMTDHFTNTRRNPFGDWVWSLTKEGMNPSVAVLEIAEDQDWANVLERKWINRFPKEQLFNQKGFSPPKQLVYPPIKRGLTRLESQEKNLIFATLKECNGNKVLTAIQLGMSRSTLYYKIRAYQVSV